MSCHLLFLVGQLRSGGLERQLYYLLKSLNRRYYQPEVVVWHFVEPDIYVRQIRALGVPLHSFPDSFSGFRKLTAFRRLVMRIRPEVVHSYTFYTNFAAFWATRGTKVIAIGAVRSDFARSKKDSGLILGRLSARWPHRQIFNNSAAAESARRCKGLFVPKDCLVVRNGVDLRRFYSLPQPTNGKIQIVGIGSLFAVKRWDRLLATALALKQAGFNCHFRIAGEGPLRASLEQRAFVLRVND